MLFREQENTTKSMVNKMNNASKEEQIVYPPKKKSSIIQTSFHGYPTDLILFPPSTTNAIFRLSFYDEMPFRKFKNLLQNNFISLNISSLIA